MEDHSLNSKNEQHVNSILSGIRNTIRAQRPRVHSSHFSQCFASKLCHQLHDENMPFSCPLCSTVNTLLTMANLHKQMRAKKEWLGFVPTVIAPANLRPAAVGPIHCSAKSFQRRHKRAIDRRYHHWNAECWNKKIQTHRYTRCYNPPKTECKKSSESLLWQS